MLILAIPATVFGAGRSAVHYDEAKKRLLHAAHLAWMNPTPINPMPTREWYFHAEVSISKVVLFAFCFFIFALPILVGLRLFAEQTCGRVCSVFRHAPVAARRVGQQQGRISAASSRKPAMGCWKLLAWYDSGGQMHVRGGEPQCRAHFGQEPAATPNTSSTHHEES